MSKVDLPVVVGVDGSSASLAAVDYAVDEAALRKSPLLILYGHLRHSPVSPWRTRTEPYVIRGIRRLLDAVADQARTRDSSIDVSVELQLDEPGAAIVSGRTEPGSWWWVTPAAAQLPSARWRRMSRHTPVAR